MDECIDSLGDIQVFSRQHANSGCWPIEVDKADREKIAFTSYPGLYQFIGMPLGLENAPAMFRRVMDVIF